MCYIHERSILIERSLKACYKNLPYEKTTRVTRTTYISTCILARAMKLLLQALQLYIILFKSS